MKVSVDLVGLPVELNPGFYLIIDTISKQRAAEIVIFFRVCGPDLVIEWSFIRNRMPGGGGGL